MRYAPGVIAAVLRAMPRYFFNCEVNGQRSEDEEGLEVHSLEAVENEAMRSALAIACDEFPADAGNGVVTVEVRDGRGQLIVTVRSCLTTTVKWSGADQD